VLRRIVVLALVALVVGLGVATASTQAATIDDDRQPCVSSVECAGASVLVGIGLAMVVPAVLSGPPALAPVTRLISRPRTLRPRLAASRLYRPPRPS
jgi:hypothetical protein